LKTKENKMSMNLSDQAVGAVMMALQKSLMDQSDIVPTLKEFEFKNSENGLMVMNPTIVKFGMEEIPEDQLENDAKV
tara:strand:+ start:623 stop:853 length:231 start_codon:yes stop_codon:yes gene_type:complete